MSTVQAPTTPRIVTSLSTEQAQAVAAELQPTVTDLIDLALTGKQLHWAVFGPRFGPVHEHLDDLVDTYRDYSDTIAEYLSTVAICPDGRAVRVASDVAVDPVEAEFVHDVPVIDVMVDRIQALTVAVRERAGRLAAVDPAAEDLLIELIRVLDKQLWMTSAMR